MGIPGLYGRWLAKNNRQIRAIMNGLPPNVASLSLDLNGIFHEARTKVLAGAKVDPRIQQALASTDPLLLENEIFNAIVGLILELVQAAAPQDCLILSVDGVAPGAKMQQQRARRERSAYERSPNEIFDTNAITPGTGFMIRLDAYLKRFIGSYRDYLPPKVIYSSHLVPGEGEHKIMDFYRRGEVSSGEAAKQGAAHVIHGLDADFIMLTLLSPVNNIYWGRPTNEGLMSVHIDAVKQYLLDRTRKESAIDDFVVLMMLMGNDFLPHFPALIDMAESIDELIDIYTRGAFVLTQAEPNGRRSIHWEGLKQYLAAVAARENEYLDIASKRVFKHPSRFFQVAIVDGVFHPDRFRAGWYQNALGTKGPKPLTDSILRIIGGYMPTQRDSDIYGPIVAQPITAISPLSVDRIEKMAVDYMRTMAWVYLYYREGTAAVNHNLAYPYYHTPMLRDLAAIAQSVGVSRTITDYETYPGMKPFTALHQLVAVLPLKSKALVPVELQPLFEYNSIIRDFFPTSFIIERDGTDEDHQGIPIVPLIDRQRVLDAVAQIYFTMDRAKIWAMGADEVYMQPAEAIERLRQLQFQRQRQQQWTQRQEDAKKRREGRLPREGRPPREHRPPREQRPPRDDRPPREGQRQKPLGLVPAMSTTQTNRSPNVPSPQGEGRRFDTGVIMRPPVTPFAAPGPAAIFSSPVAPSAPIGGQTLSLIPSGLSEFGTGGPPPLTGGLPPLTGGLPPLTGGLPPIGGTTPSMGLQPIGSTTPSMGLQPIGGATSSMGLSPIGTATSSMGLQPIGTATSSMGLSPIGGATPSMGLSPIGGATSSMGLSPIGGATPSMGSSPGVRFRPIGAPPPATQPPRISSSFSRPAGQPASSPSQRKELPQLM